MQHFCNCVIGLAFLYWKEQNVSPQLRIIYSQKLYLLKHTRGVNYYVFHINIYFLLQILHIPIHSDRYRVALSDDAFRSRRITFAKYNKDSDWRISEDPRPVLKNICQCGKKGKLCFCKVKTIRWSKVAIIH